MWAHVHTGFLFVGFYWRGISPCLWSISSQIHSLLYFAVFTEFDFSA
ncbi:hypothetical protein VCHENC02_3268 [Vibrio harveyi]|uniref:Uncharacterized protein n=1 Tax=Vibrio harveyi TaxID=669 RepID=A0A454CXD6_VIBHA|nr:hypothetical protein VCHENC02_3268 [Vibrio harveyi]